MSTKGEELDLTAPCYNFILCLPCGYLHPHGQCQRIMQPETTPGEVGLIRKDKTSVWDYFLYDNGLEFELFFGKANIGSNHHPAEIRYGGKKFSCVEQYYMYQKADLETDVSGVHLLSSPALERGKPARANRDKMASFFLKDLANFCGVLTLLFVACIDYTSARLQYEYVTCGSVLKLVNTRLGVRLHSHDVKYGSGSGQQSVTAVEAAEDHNSYWRVTGFTEGSCMRGTPIKCGQTVRLTHVNTGRNLHSHHFQSPLSHNLEVSAFGEGGSGDDGDNWEISCSGSSWRRDERVRLRNIVTDSFLHVTGDTYGRPIHGQKEVCGYPSPSELNYWKAAEGIFIKPVEINTFYSHDEL